MAVLDGASGIAVIGASNGATRLNHGSTSWNSSDSEARSDLDEVPSPAMPGPRLPPARLSAGVSCVLGSATPLKRDGVGRGPFLRPHHDPTASVAASSAKVKGQELQRGQSEGKDRVEGRGVVVGLQCSDEGFKKDVRDLAELLSKLNPMAKEFVPPLLAQRYGYDLEGVFRNDFGVPEQTGHGKGNISANGVRRKTSNYSQGKRKNNRTGMAQREETIRRTVYVSDIDQQVTEEQLAALFINCGHVVDCRICGDPNSILRFAFIEFTDEEGARAALSLAGTMLGYYPVRVLPSKTAIAPVNPTFLPRSEDEREMCARTIYCTNIDKRISQTDVKLFFETVCGKVHRLRLLGDYNHATRIAFVEFVMAESAIAALNCSGVVLRSLPIRISPSKTPVHPRSPRSSMP